MATKAKILGNRRRDHIGQLRLMAGTEGYVMVRRPGCMPFVITAKEWEKLPIFENAPIAATTDQS